MAYVYPRAYEGGSGSAPGSANNFAAVDSAATGDYIGASSSTGVIRTGAGLTYVDGGNFVTLDVATGAGSAAAVAAIDVDATPGYLGAASGDGILRVGSGLTYVDGGDFITLDVAAASAGLVAVDVSATPDYIGAASGDGALRTGEGIDYVDGGNFVTLAFNEATVTGAVNWSSASSFQVPTTGVGAAVGATGAQLYVESATATYVLYTQGNRDGLATSLFYNSNVGANAGKRVWIRTDGGFDAYLSFDIALVSWSIGIDNSNSDSFVIGTGAVLSATAPFQITAAGAIDMQWAASVRTPTLGVGATPSAGTLCHVVATTSTAYALRVNHTGNAVGVSRFVNFDTGASAGQSLQIETAGAGDPITWWTVAAQSWVAGIDNSNGDSFGIQPASALTTTPPFMITTGGAIDMSNAASVRLPATGVGAAASGSAQLLVQSTTATYVIQTQSNRDSVATNLFLNSNTGASAGQRLWVRADGGGDPYIHFDISNGVGQFSVGVDNSNGDAFAINPSSSLSSLSPFMITQAGDVQLENARSLRVPDDATASLPTSPAAGMLHYDTTANKLKVYTGAAWETITSA